MIFSFFTTLAALAFRVAPGEVVPCHIAGDGWCGSVKVPTSYRHPERGEVDLGYEVLPSRRAGAPALIVVNGGPGGRHDNFHEVKAFEKLRDRYKVVFYDQRGTGSSPMDDEAVLDCENVSTEANAEDLERVRRAVSGDRAAAVYAHSYGGWIALLHAERYPERVTKLVLHSSALGARPFERQETVESDGPETGFILWDEYLDSAPSKYRTRLTNAEEDVERLVRTKGLPVDRSTGREVIDSIATWRTVLQILLSMPEAADAKYVAELLEDAADGVAGSRADLGDLVDSIFDQLNFDVNHTVVCSDFHVAEDPFRADPRVAQREIPAECLGLKRCESLNLEQWISRVRAKTLVLGGSYDSLTPLDEQEAIARKIPGARLVVFDRSGHDAMDEEPRKFARVLRRFLDGRG